MAAKGTADIGLLVSELRKDGLQKTALAERVAADGAHGLPERVPANRTCEIRKRWVINMLLKLFEKILGSLETADTQGRQSTGHAKLRSPCRSCGLLFELCPEC